MARLAPTVLIEDIDKTTYNTTQVLLSDGIWAVYYKENPINLKTQNSLIQSPVKYKKVSFSNPGPAKQLAKKLNTQFNTSDFSVVSLSDE